MADMSGKAVAITGASSGIGEATALAVARAGASVALGARRADRIEALARRIEEENGAVALEVDVYNLTKFGVNAFSEGLRQEVTEGGIRVMVAEPGFVATELQSHNKGDALEGIEGMRDQIGDVLQAEEIADAILYAVSRAPTSRSTRS